MKNFDAKYKILVNFEEKVAFLATADKIGKPNLIAVEISKVTSNGEIVISNNHIKISIKNITENNRCVLVITDNEKIWWRIFGTAFYQNKGKWSDYVKNLDTNKDYKTKGALIIKIKRIDDLDTGVKNI